MKKNMGKTDKIIRLILALIFVLLFSFEVVTGGLGILLLVFASVFILTSTFSFVLS